MILRKLVIERKRWGEHAGSFSGEISFENELGAVAICLSPEQCDKLFQVCADGIVDTAKEAARNLTCSVIEHKTALEADR